MQVHDRFVVYEPGDPLPPPHDADVCGQCTFVANPDCVVVTRQQREQAELTPGKLLKALGRLYDLEDSIIPLGRFTMPRWSGHNMFWLFVCPECQEQSLDYLHGRHLYLTCKHCKNSVVVKGARFYEEACAPRPMSSQKEAQHLKELGTQHNN